MAKKAASKQRRQSTAPSTQSAISVLIGAGAVADADLPTSAQLADRFHKYLKSQADTIEGRLQLELHRFLEGAIRFQRGTCGEDPGSPVNIEQLATACLRLRSRTDNPVTPYVSGWHQRLIEFERSASTVLDDYTSALFGRLRHELATPPDTKLSYLTGLADLRREGRVDVFSLNYDLCFERVFSHLLPEPFVNGFSEKGWTPHLLDNAEFRYIKLHGSLDWIDDAELGICSLEYPPHADASLSMGQQPLLIFGTDSKLTGKDPFLTLLYTFSRVLESCELLITIGYSFADQYINEIISQRFAANTRLTLIAVGVDDLDQCINSVPALRESPRVLKIADGARRALEQKTLLKMTRSTLQNTRDAEPF